MISVRAVHLLKLPVSAGSSESYRRKHRANLNFIFRCPLCDVLSLIQLAVMNQENQIAVNHDHQDPKIPNSDRIRTRTWRFDLTLRVPPLSGQEDVLQVVRSILNKAHDNLAISGLDQSSFSYDVPDGELAQVSGYLHSARAAIHQTAVRPWIYDDRVQGEIKWTAVLPGKNCDWKQHAQIADILAAGNGRRLEDWVGDSSAPVNRGGRPRKTPAPADGQPRQPRGRPPKPVPVAADSPAEAAVRARLNKLLADGLHRLCDNMFPGQHWAGQSKACMVQKLMARHDELARMLKVAPAAETCPADQPPAAMQAALFET